ncbi:MAG: acyl-CoA dehydrogenase family protein, partial [Brevibacterium yomogidense]
FTDARVPQSGRVGAENDGWTVAKQLLTHERGGSAQSPSMRRRLDVLRVAAAATSSPFGGSLADDAVFQRDLGELEADVASCEHFEKLAISGHPIAEDPAYPSLNKVMSSELIQRISALMTRVVGLDGMPDQREALRVGSHREALGDDLALIAMPFYLNSRATTIYAGTNEVQRDLIARSLRA